MPTCSEDAADSAIVTGEERANESDHPLAQACRFLIHQFDRAIGIVTLFVFLAVISVIPLLNLLSLGLLLEASSRVARSGRIRDGFLHLGMFARIGKAVLGIWLWTLPIRLVYGLWRDAELIQAASEKADTLRYLLSFLIVTISLHLVSACVRGGRFRDFFSLSLFQWLRWIKSPPRFPRPGKITAPLRKVVRLAYRLGRLGLLGFLGAFAWLALPVLLLFLSASAERQGIALIGSLLGGIILGGVALILPFLQTRFAFAQRFGAFFEVAEVKILFRRAPFA
ncbi:MAG: hypothetical protein AAF357_19630, partial [Verrucomicrobiota bacterium]